MNNVAPIYRFVKRSGIGLTPEKDKIRNLTINVIHEYFLKSETKKVEFLTLPSAWWNFERLIKKRFFDFYSFRIRPSFVGCERDYVLFKVASIKIANSNKTFKQKYVENLQCEYLSNGSCSAIFNIDVFDFINASEKKFNCLWLDTTTPISRIDHKLLKIGKVLHDHSMVILTVLKGREHYDIKLDRTDYISTIMGYSGLKLIHKWEYMDSSPMLHLIYVKT